jgi:hypothetical protein
MNQSLAIPGRSYAYPAADRGRHERGSTMKRLILLALTTLSIAAGTMLSPATSLAADSTCSMHILKATSWSVQSDQFNDSWDFQCGGSNNESWDVGIYLQWRDSNATWHTFDCDNGNPCYAASAS